MNVASEIADGELQGGAGDQTVDVSVVMPVVRAASRPEEVVHA